MEARSLGRKIPDANPVLARPIRNPVSYSYRAYGLELNSSSPIRALQHAPSESEKLDLQFEDGCEPDWVRALLSLPGKILIRRQPVEGDLDPAFVLTEYGQGEGFELAYSDETRFVVDGAAQHIWGTCRPPVTPEEREVYLLGPVMGFLFRRRQMTCLHSSAVELRGRAICFCGEAGFGKSTTAAALALNGVPVVAEDIVVLEEMPDRFQAVPGYPRVCLWPESVQMLLGREDALPLIAEGWEKRYLPLDGKRAKFATGKLPLGAVYLFADRADDPGAPRIEKLSPREGLLQLVQNTYMNWLLSREQRAAEFKTLCRLVQQVPVRCIVAHSRPEKLTQLCELLVQDAGEILVSGKDCSESVCR